MRLSKLYANKPDIFLPIHFAPGLNVVLGEIRLPANKEKDTHNLGKTTLGRLLDFGFLARTDARFFLVKHADRFKEFVFFLEIELGESSFVTVRRSVMEPTKISFKKHRLGRQNYTHLSESGWNHWNVPFDRARDLLDGLLDWRALKPWSFRKGLGYQLRSQDDYRDVYQLRRLASAAHSEWKPYLAHILGFKASLIGQHYAKERDLEKKKATEKTLKSELGGSVEDLSKIEGLLLLKRDEAAKKQALLDAFDFRARDREATRQLVEEIDQEIAARNQRRYSLNQNKKRIMTSLDDDIILFDPEEAKRLFAEAGILFEGQIKKDFEQLIAFNRAITDERGKYLLEEKAEIESEAKTITSELNALNKRRSATLAFLSSTDVFTKYKRASDEMATLKADIISLERQRDLLHRLQTLRYEIRQLGDEIKQVQEQIEADVEKQNSNKDSLFSKIRLSFNEIVEGVIDRKALLSVAPNREGHLEFKADILDEAGNATSAGLGYTYRKLLCIAFDLAVLRSHLNVRFPRFVFHDGVFESLDDRKKERLLDVIRRLAGEGLQPIITLIDSDLPKNDEATPVFEKDEIVVLLHDEGDDGRLFKMPTW
ncbi:MAG: DUF2326 domain-containing protein [Hyphomicrobiaceae bacterium]|uniref:DUF2326 domain-containing protein n=1 Tax=Pseudorhodoplanes sp. TaxID=1934341 RepID=UPI003D0EFF39